MLPALVRIAGITVAALVAYFVMIAIGGDSGANIGAGLAVFAVLAFGAFGWAMRDGLREQLGLGDLLLRWLIVAAVVPVLLTLVISLTTGSDSIGTAIVSTWFFFAALTGLPAVIGASVGNAMRG
ncbi:hypothetical protein BCF74_11178 [Knoellia remsis]|uniref:Uncharacterized protein n=1 Tax=Knoellia remsis TaxID=407159 RepID=A0A2T0ULT9_9MICO|nr:hypothetical protein [Knoellia remsis]PRY58797.1 hypothetical protein BCF74_11178 [Knoellia remsis]